MQPLLKIQNIPISIEYSSTRAALRQPSPTSPPKYTMQRNRGNASIQTSPARVNLDSTEARASAGIKSPFRSVQEFAQAGVSAAQQATRQFADNGNQMLDSHGKGDPIADIASSKMMTSTETIMAFIPNQPVQMTPEAGSISFDYSMDKLTFDWSTNQRQQMEFVPANIEFSVKQYPDVVIEYVGDWIYAPPSANPNYEGPALNVSA